MVKKMNFPTFSISNADCIHCRMFSEIGIHKCHSGRCLSCSVYQPKVSR